MAAYDAVRLSKLPSSPSSKDAPDETTVFPARAGAAHQFSRRRLAAVVRRRAV